MIIKSLSGKTIVETDHKTMRRTLEWCADNGVDLSNADLRNLRLSHASLDGLRAPDACFWGADLTASDLGFADLRKADLRCAKLKDSCLAESNLSHSDLQGAYFSRTIIEAADLSGATVSCPSFWDCDLPSAASIQGLVYNHLGEEKIIITKAPLVIEGYSKRLIVMHGHCLWGKDLYAAGTLPCDARQALFEARTVLDKTMRADLHTANFPMPKIGGGIADF